MAEKALAFQTAEIVQHRINVRDHELSGDGSTVETAKWNELESILVDGDHVVFPKGSYKGSFKTKKAISFTFEKGAQLVNSGAGDGVLHIGPESADFTSYAVTESSLENLDNQFTVVGASTYFSVGDIGYLWDNATRPSDDEPVNYECIKIAAIAGDLVTVEGHLRSYKGAGSIVFYHSAFQPKNVQVSGFSAAPDDTHTSYCCMVRGVDGVKILDSETENTTGNAVAARFSYNVNVSRAKIAKPRLVTSGYGYGVALLGVTGVTVRDVTGESTRHVLDADSVYLFNYDNIRETDDQSAPVMVGHNGFCGYGAVRNIYVKTTQYAVNVSESGFSSGANRASKSNHPLRHVDIETVDVTMASTVDPDDNGTRGVYIQTNVDDVNINKVTVRHESSASLTTAAASNIVRVNGVAVGHFSVSNIEADRIGRFFYGSGDRDGATTTENLTCIENCSADSVDEPILATGYWSLSVDKLFMGEVLNSTIITMNSVSGDDPQALYVGQTIHYQGTSRQLFSTSANVAGEFTQISKDSNTRIDVTASYNLSAIELQNRGKWAYLRGPSGAGSVSLGAFPASYIDGQQISITGWVTGYNDVVIPASLTNVFTAGGDITFDSSTPSHILVAHSGEWRLLI